ncbi:MAG: DHH family phosphoesterase [Bacilli bacterium]
MKNLNPLIIEQARKYKAEYKSIYRAIKQFDRIAIFTHITPDFDALGSQFGLYTWLQDNFPEKDIRVLGSNHPTYTPHLYPSIPELDDQWFEKPFLAIVVDTSTSDRVSDQRFQQATIIIKIDHHPPVDQYGDINLVDTELVAAAEAVTNLIVYRNTKFSLSKEAAIYLYSGIAGDSRRFLYQDTTIYTFANVTELLKTGFNLTTDVYNKMYVETLQDLALRAHILTHYRLTDHGVAYYILDDETLKEFERTTDQGKEFVNIFNGIEGVNAWFSASEDRQRGIYKVSLRSKDTPINQVATKYRGGGHAQASGATLHSREEIDLLVADLDALFPKTIRQ